MLFAKQSNFLLLAILSWLLIYLQMELWAKNDGVQYGWNITSQLTKQEILNRDLAANNSKLEQEIAELQNSPKVLEKHARLKLGFILPNETYYTYS